MALERAGERQKARQPEKPGAHASGQLPTRNGLAQPGPQQDEREGALGHRPGHRAFPAGARAPWAVAQGQPSQPGGGWDQPQSALPGGRQGAHGGQV